MTDIHTQPGSELERNATLTVVLPAFGIGPCQLPAVGTTAISRSWKRLG